MKTFHKFLVSLALAFAGISAWAQSKIWDEVVTGFPSDWTIDVTRVAMHSDRTEVTLHIEFMAGQKLGLKPSTMLVADGKQYAVRSISSFTLGEEFTLPRDTMSFLVTFQPVPLTTRSLDFVEPGGWKVTNIRSVAEVPDGIADTYWRDTKTGDWLIGIGQKHVVYRSEVREIKDWQALADDTYTLTLADGTVIRIGRLKTKKGQSTRTFAIGQEKAVTCNPITGKALPDYPTRDERRGFVDNGYAGDTVTIVGWLKDMNERARKVGNEFGVMYYDLLLDGRNPTSYYADLDSLGRFTLKVPVLNSQRMMVDRGRSCLWPVLEAGKTYFLLRDFKTGQDLWMGDDVRLQNEMQAVASGWLGILHEAGPDAPKVDPMQFLARTDSARMAFMAHLQEVIGQHPTLSQRYIDYAIGNVLAEQGREMGQVRFDTPRRYLPQEYMDYIGQEIWRKLPMPFTIYWASHTFMTDYLDQIQSTQGDNWALILLRDEKEGKIMLSDEEKRYLAEYPARIKQIRTETDAAMQAAKNEDERESIYLAYLESDFAKTWATLRKRHGELLELADYQMTLDIIDSVGCDPGLRDMALGRRLYETIDHDRKPLAPHVVEMAEREIHSPGIKASLQAKQDEFLALEAMNIDNSPCLKSADDVAGLTDGEAILRKILEPYKGRIVLLDIWGTWCSPCKEGLSHSDKEYEQLKELDVVYLYLANNSPEKSWKNVIKEYKVLGDNVVHYNLPKAQQQAVERFLNVSYFPTYKVIDREGKILDTQVNPLYDLEGLKKTLKGL